jgi:hypothetical protein
MKRETFKSVGALWLAPVAALYLVSAAAEPQGNSSPAPSASMSKTFKASAAVEMRMAMRMLWEDHIAYTRNYIISELGGLPDSDAAAQRLLRNQDDIGNAFKPYYGDIAGKTLSVLLRDHIQDATEVVAAAKSGDQAKLAEAQKKWSANGKEIAKFLSGANPNWSRKTLEEMLQTHLDLTSAEVVARLASDWAADIKAYDDGHAHMLIFADMLADGIAKQFPAKFK